MNAEAPPSCQEEADIMSKTKIRTRIEQFRGNFQYLCDLDIKSNSIKCEACGHILLASLRRTKVKFTTGVPDNPGNCR